MLPSEMLPSCKFVCSKGKIIHYQLPTIKPSELIESKVEGNCIFAYNESYPLPNTNVLEIQQGRWILKFNKKTEKDSIDSVWTLIKNGIKDGSLYIATVSAQSKTSDEQIISVFKPDSTNDIEIYKIFETLTKLGIKSQYIHGYMNQEKKYVYLFTDDDSSSFVKLQTIYKNNQSLAQELKNEVEIIKNRLERETKSTKYKVARFFNGDVKSKKKDGLEKLIEKLTIKNDDTDSEVNIKVSDLIAEIRANYSDIDAGFCSRTKEILDQFVKASIENLASINSTTTPTHIPPLR